MSICFKGILPKCPSKVAKFPKCPCSTQIVWSQIFVSFRNIASTPHYQPPWLWYLKDNKRFYLLWKGNFRNSDSLRKVLKIRKFQSWLGHFSSFETFEGQNCNFPMYDYVIYPNFFQLHGPNGLYKAGKLSTDSAILKSLLFHCWPWFIDYHSV